MNRQDLSHSDPTQSGASGSCAHAPAEDRTITGFATRDSVCDGRVVLSTVTDPVIAPGQTRSKVSALAATGSPAGSSHFSFMQSISAFGSRIVVGRPRACFQKTLALVASLLILAATAPAIASSNGATYQTDALGRLTKVIFDDGTAINYNYDAMGNRSSTCVSCSDPEKLTFADVMTDFLVSGLIGAVPTAQVPLQQNNITTPNSIALNSDNGLLWVNSTNVGSGTAYDTMALGTADNFVVHANYSGGASSTPEGVSTLCVPNRDLVINTVNTGSGHAFIPSSSTSAGTPVSLAAASVFASLSPDGSTAAFALVNGTISLSTSADNFGSVTSTFAVSPNPLSITFDSSGSSVWISYLGSSVIEQYSLTGSLLQTFDLGSANPSYNFMKVSGSSLVVTSKTDNKVFVVDLNGPSIANTIDLSRQDSTAISPNELAIQNATAYVLGLDSADSHYKIVRFVVGTANFVILNTGLQFASGLAINNAETHAYTVGGQPDGSQPAVTNDFLLPTAVIPAGIAYDGGGRLIVPQTSQYLAPSSDTYQFLQTDGSSHFDAVANGAAQPTDTGLLLSKMVTNATGLVSIAQLAPSSPTIRGVSPLPSLPAANIFVGDNSGQATALPVSGDASLSSAGSLTVNSTHGSAFATSATTDATNASNIATGTLAIARGGTGAGTAAGARSNLSAAASGANADIISISGLTTPLSATQGGTGLSSSGTDATKALMSDGAGGFVMAVPAGGGGTPGGLSGQVQFNSAGSFGGFTLSGDGALDTSTGALTVTKTNGTVFAPSATVDATNASNISTGTLSASHGGTGLSSSGTDITKAMMSNGANGWVVGPPVSSTVVTSTTPHSSAASSTALFLPPGGSTIRVSGSVSVTQASMGSSVVISGNGGNWTPSSISIPVSVPASGVLVSAIQAVFHVNNVTPSTLSGSLSTSGSGGMTLNPLQVETVSSTKNN